MPEEYAPIALEKILEEIDKELVGRDVALHARQIQARISFSNREKISLPISKSPRGVENPHVTKTAERIAEFIDDWYEEKYAELLHYNFVLGEILAKISGNYVVVRVPTVWGADPTPIWEPDNISEIGRSYDQNKINIASLVKGITPKLAASASSKDIEEICYVFSAGVEVFRYLDTNKNSNALLNEVLNDFKASTTYFQNQNSGFGQSRWSSLQAVEKMMKYVLTVRGIAYKYNHNLKQLADLIGHDVCVPADRISKVQVRAGVRYGELGSTRAEAFDAHIAALDILLRISRRMDITRGYDELL